MMNLDEIAAALRDPVAFDGSTGEREVLAQQIEKIAHRRTEPVEIMQCAVWYFHNVEPDEQLRAARGAEARPMESRYRDEKLADYKAGLVVWWNRFDPERQQRWIEAAIEMYGGSV